MLPGLAGIAGFLGQVKTVTYLSSSSSSSSVSSTTISGASFGTVSNDRRIVVAIATDSVSSLSLSVTIGGVSATLLVARRFNGPSIAFYVANVPTGSTGDIAVTFGTTVTDYCISHWAIYGLLSNTPVDTDSVSVDEASTGSVTVTTTEGGITLAATATDTDVTMSWTNVTEDFDSSLAAGFSASGGKATNTGTSLSVTATFSSGVGRGVLAVVTF